jgi:hypothetical protein
MTTTPARHPHHAIDTGADHPNNACPQIKPSGTHTGRRLACPPPGRAA